MKRGALRAADAWLLCVAMTMGCGGSEFTTQRPGGDAAAKADGQGATDASGSPDAAAGDGAARPSDAASDALSPSDGGSPDAGCTLGPGATDVYVDARFQGTIQTGSALCPFSTIAQGLATAAALTGTRTVHVAGATPALVYRETGPLTVPSGVTLLGAGSAEVSISAAGTCATTTCAVVVEGGGALAGATVTCASGDGIVTLASTPAPVVHDVVASGSMGNGILVLGAADLGPNLSANGNGSSGVESPATATGLLHVIGTTNTFDNNVANGINFDGAAVLQFEGGSANGNAQGLRLGGAAAGGHTITGLTATGNKGPGGFVAYSGQTIKLRSSVLLGNAGVGFYYAYANGSTLDLGTSASDLGSNTFGGVTAAGRNAKAGLRLCGTGAAVAQLAYGDLWSTCPPTQTSLACDAAITTYSDVVYGFGVAVSVGPVTASDCTTGP